MTSSSRWQARAQSAVALAVALVTCTAGAVLGETAEPAAVVAADDSWILYADQANDTDGMNTAIYLVRPDGTGRHRLVHTMAGSEIRATWSPDGQQVAYVQATFDGRGEGGLWIVNADGSHPTRLLGCELPCNTMDYPDWAPDGRSIIFSADSDAPDPDSPPATFEIWCYDLDTGEAGPVLTRADGMTVEQPRLSPDGSQVVYVRGDVFDETRGTALFIVDLEGGPERRLTEWGLFAAHPDWSIDDRIVFNSYDFRIYPPDLVPGARDLYSIGSDGTDLRQLTDNGPDGDRSTQATWTPDGTAVVFNHWDGSRIAIATVDADGGDARWLTPSPVPGGEPELRPVSDDIGLGEPSAD